MALGLYELINNINKQIKSICCKVNALLDSGAGSYKVYTALLTQSGGSEEIWINSDDPAPLVPGVTYTIVLTDGTADWTNVGAPNNNLGTSFVATGTTPTTWGTFGENSIAYNAGAPVVTVLENTIGNIWFTYVSPGDYLINSNSLFTSNKTISSVSPNFIYESVANPYVVYVSGSPNQNEILLRSFDDTLPSDNIIGYVCQYNLEIRVYN